MERKRYLSSFDLLRIEIVGFGYIEMRGDVLLRHTLQHPLLDHDVMVISLVLLLLEVIHYRDLGRVVLQHQLDWH